MMWDANYAGPFYRLRTYGKAPMMLSMLGAIVGDSAVQRAMNAYAKTWRFKHPSPWDFMFAMNRELKQNLDWFWYYWLFTTESVDESIAKASVSGGKAQVTVRQEGEMPSPVVLQGGVRAERPGAKPDEERGDRRPHRDGDLAGGCLVRREPDASWRTWTSAERRSRRSCSTRGQRFPDRDFSDNVWPRASCRRSRPALSCGQNSWGIWAALKVPVMKICTGAGRSRGWCARR